jgi:hypothetical protein
LSIDKYIDNNNFLRYNIVNTRDSRMNILKSSQYEFFDLYAQPVWVSDKGYSEIRNMSIEGAPYR